MVEVSLSIRSENAPPEAAERWDTILWPWAELDAETGVRVATEDYFDTEKWDEWFGPDLSNAHVLVTVHSPASIAGIYSVELWRVTKARVLKK
jgi:hypothetical protein